MISRQFDQGRSLSRRDGGIYHFILPPSQGHSQGIIMFCDYCLQLLDFSQGVTPHAPQQKPLGGDTRAFTNNQAFQRAETPALRMKIHEDDLRSEFEPLWWRAPAQQKDSPNLLSHSPDSNCAICNMIFSNVSASIVEGLRRFPQDTSSLHFVYKLDKGTTLF